uniref:Uncharacterized protein n=1 Tax=Oryza brachyantha TaxID=4533 RepID=J3KU52_ORYBR
MLVLLVVKMVRIGSAQSEIQRMNNLEDGIFCLLVKCGIIFCFCIHIQCIYFIIIIFQKSWVFIPSI